MPPVVVTVTDPAEYPAACRALVAHVAEPDRTARAERTLRLIREGELDPAGLLVARKANRLVGGILIQFTPGNAAVSWLPRAEPEPDRERIELVLAEAAVTRFFEAGVKVAQTFCAPAHRDAAKPLERAGFRHVTQIEFLCRPVDPAIDRNAFDPPTSPLAFEPLTGSSPLVAEVLLGTYDGTRDCPELNGARTADEVLTGNAVRPTPPSWFLVRRRCEPVGLVMFAPGPQPGILDLSYLGLVPSARGQGLGRELVNFALVHAAHSNVEWLNLSVDVRNEPALRLYRAQAFRSYDLQDVFLWRPSW